tara:strand:+ start:339 stop:755 length:417 start_codon:yes stop_codon:yes gene_type:complete
MLPFVKVVVLILVLVLVATWIFKNHFKSDNNSIDVSEIVISKKLHFYDHPDGSIRITDIDGEILTIIEGEAFVRVLLRNLVRERILIGIGPEEPFELIARKGGLLSLRDPISDSHVDLTAFGASNSKVFVELIEDRDT